MNRAFFRQDFPPVPVEGLGKCRIFVFLPGNKQSPVHFPFDMPNAGIESSGLGRMTLLPDLHSPLLRSAFLDRRHISSQKSRVFSKYLLERSVTSVQISGIYF